MIPILYSRNERDFSTNGLGRLSDIISCLVTEERNGPFEVEFQYPVTGVHYSELKESAIISVTHDDNGDRQPFRIYRRSAPINGIVTFNARHLCYDLRNVIVAPYTANNCAGALSGLATHAMTDCEFTFWTDKVAEANWKLERPASAWELLGGSEGSILDVFGTGEYKLDNTTVKLYLHRGEDNGVTIRYAKNLTDLVQEVDSGEIYNAIVPYWTSEEGTTVYGDVVVGNAVPLALDYWTNENGLRITNQNGVPFEFAYFKLSCVPYDFSDRFEEQPTKEQLNAVALSFLNNNKPWIPHENLEVDFVPLWQTDEYAKVAPLQKVKLCDTVRIVYTELGVNAESKVIKTVYNPLLDRYDKIELGDARSSFAETIVGEMDEKLVQAQETFEGIMGKAIDHATDLITGGMGGNVVIKRDAYGKPTEILIMDSEDPDQAVHVLRMNVNGIGFSSSGINGPYSTAWTIDGSFVADFITSGNINANLITTGTINASLIKAGTLDCSLINVVNLNANNVTLTGTFESVESDPFAAETNNKVFVSGGGVYLERENGTGLGQLDTAYGYVGDDIVPLGGELVLNNRSGRRGVMLFADDNGGAITAYNTSGTGFVSITNNSFGYGPDGDYLIYISNGGVDVYDYLEVHGDLRVTGNKARVIDTQHYGKRILSAYETAEPFFGDIGESTIGVDGAVTIHIDDLFGETVQKTDYQVFLQAYGRGECFVSDRGEDSFTVEGTPGLSFGWEIKAHQVDYDGVRLKEVKR